MQYIGRDGTVQGILYSGDVIVRYRNGKILHLNRDCLTQVYKQTAFLGRNISTLTMVEKTTWPLKSVLISKMFNCCIWYLGRKIHV